MAIVQNVKPVAPEAVAEQPQKRKFRNDEPIVYEIVDLLENGTKPIVYAFSPTGKTEDIIRYNPKIDEFGFPHYFIDRIEYVERLLPNFGGRKVLLVSPDTLSVTVLNPSHFAEEKEFVAHEPIAYPDGSVIWEPKNLKSE